MPSCPFILDNGTPCQAPPREGRRFCRHHDPENFQPKPAPKPKPARFTDPWRRMHQEIAAAPGDGDLCESLELTIAAVGEGRISHRRAGALLAAIDHRRRQLHQQHLDRLLEFAIALGSQAPEPPDPLDGSELPLDLLIADVWQDLEELNPAETGHLAES